MPDLAAINVRRRLVLTKDDRVLPITDFFDCQGDPTDDAELAVSAVAGEEGCWFAFKLDDFVPAFIH